MSEAASSCMKFFESKMERLAKLPPASEVRRLLAKYNHPEEDLKKTPSTLAKVKSVSSILDRKSIMDPRKGGSYTKAERTAKYRIIDAMLREGKRRQDIAKAANCSLQTVTNRANAIGIKIPRGAKSHAKQKSAAPTVRAPQRGLHLEAFSEKDLAEMTSFIKEFAKAAALMASASWAIGKIFEKQKHRNKE